MERIHFTKTGQPNDQEKSIEEIKQQIFDRQTSKEYERLAEKVGLIKLKTSYAESLDESFSQDGELSDLGKIMQEAIKDGIVLDLGCGQDYHLSKFFMENGAKLYIGVDLEPDIFIPEARVVPNNHRDRSYMKRILSEANREKEAEVVATDDEEEDFISDKGPEYSLRENILQIKDDMLKAISRIKDKSINAVVISGIEISFENTEETNKYLKALRTEIKRVLKEQGVVLINQSDFSINDFVSVAKDESGDWKVIKSE
ncbi:MAG TPA: hypothetical protein ENN31_00140 [Candidatus Vogelbacteria bacterium]|nr:hypothetical protein [Candidatus Vogelbacteria bacterium]